MTENGADPARIRLALEADERGRISNRTFEDVDIHGPAVCVLIGGHGELTGCSFDAPPHAVFWEVPERDLAGLVRLQNCRFLNCRFHAVAFVGPAATIAEIHRSYGEPEPGAG